MQNLDDARARVLIVDDDTANLVVLLEMLLSEGISATAVTSGAEALELLAHAPFDAVLLDIHMPGMAGPEVLARMRARAGPNRDAPVIAVTADTFTRGYADYLALGFFELITKPVTIDTIVNCVRRAVLMSRKGGGPVVRRRRAAGLGAAVSQPPCSD